MFVTSGGGIALTMQEARAFLDDPQVTKKDDLGALYRAVTASEIILQSTLIVVFFPSPRKGESGCWLAQAAGDWYHLRDGDLLRIKRQRCRVRTFDVAMAEVG